jgi:hypothetical protein
MRMSVDNIHHRSARLEQSVPVREAHNGAPVWEGMVHVSLSLATPRRPGPSLGILDLGALMERIIYDTSKGEVQKYHQDMLTSLGAGQQLPTLHRASFLRALALGLLDGLDKRVKHLAFPKLL